MPGAAIRAWDTQEFSPQEQLQVWQQIVNEALLPVEIDCARAAEGFAAALQTRRLSDLAVCRLSSGEQVVRRTGQHLRRGTSGLYFLNLPTQGWGKASQDGRTALTHAGDFVLVDADRPFTLEFDARFEQVSLAIPHALIDPLLARPEAASCVVVSGRSGVGAIASAAIRALALQPASLSARDTRAVTEHVVELVALAISGMYLQSAPTARVRHLQAALDEIHRSLADPDLSPAVVAARIPISVSYLTKLFAEQGTTFGRVVLQRRLDRGYALLAPDQDGGPISITAVATACGMPDPAHFSHAFHARFGLSPSARRAGRTPQR